MTIASPARHTFRVYQQLEPHQDSRTGNWYAVLFPLGVVKEEDEHAAIRKAKRQFNLRWPIVEEVDQFSS